MKYCVNYSKRFKYMNTVDEVRIQFGGKHNLDLAKVLLDNKDHSDYQNKRLIIDILSLDDFDNYKLLSDLKNLRDKAPNLNITLKFSLYTTEFETKFLAEVRDSGIPFFFAERATNWDIFNGLCELGVSDIYVCESLGFELNLIGPQAHAKGITIRAFANVCQSSWTESDPLKSFFIRPEGVPHYEKFIDVLEFFTEDIRQDNVLYRAYAIEKKWFGNLKEIIVGLNEDINSSYLLPVFDRVRVSCGKRCAKGFNCNICTRVRDVSESLESRGYYIGQRN